MSTDAIVLLKNDHKEILKTFKDFEKAGERRRTCARASWSTG